MKRFYLLGIIFIYSHLFFSQNRIIFPEDKLPGINFLDNSCPTGNDVPFLKTDSIVAVSIQESKLKLLFEYNSNGTIAAYTQLFFDGQWNNNVRDTLIYDSEGKLIQWLTLTWFNNRWDSSAILIYFYDGPRLSSTERKIYYNGWINHNRDNYEYTDEGYLKTRRVELWINNDWENWIQSTNFYSNSQLRDSTLDEIWEVDHWVYDYKSLYYYSSNNIDVDSLYRKSWNGTSWNNVFRQYYLNDNNHNQIEVIDQDWDGNSFINVGKYSYSYNQAGYLLTGNALLWDTTGNWVQGDAYLIIKNPDGLRIGFLCNNIYGYYSNVTAVEENTQINGLGYKLSDNYPNPFNPSTTINYTIPGYSYVSIKIFDILGNEIETLVKEEKPAGNYKVLWNAGSLPSGVYFCRMHAGGFVQIRKMILLR